MLKEKFRGAAQLVYACICKLVAIHPRTLEASKRRLKVLGATQAWLPVIAPSALAWYNRLPVGFLPSDSKPVLIVEIFYSCALIIVFIAAYLILIWTGDIDDEPQQVVASAGAKKIKEAETTVLFTLKYFIIVTLISISVICIATAYVHSIFDLTKNPFKEHSSRWIPILGLGALYILVLVHICREIYMIVSLLNTLVSLYINNVVQEPLNSSPSTPDPSQEPIRGEAV